MKPEAPNARPESPPLEPGLPGALAMQAALARGVSSVLRKQSRVVDAMARTSLPPGPWRESWLAAARMHAGSGERLVQWVDRWLDAFRPPQAIGEPLRGDD